MDNHYRLPDLLDVRNAPKYTKDNNVHFEELNAQYLTWIDNAEFLSAPHKQVWKDAELSLLISRTFPDSDLPHLTVYLDWMKLFLVLERLTDAASSAESRRWTELYMRILNGDDRESSPCPKKKARRSLDMRSPRRPDNSTVLKKVMKRLATGIMPQIDATYKQAFLASNQTLADGILQEAHDRESPQPKTLAEYIQTRRQSVGVQPFLVLARWTFDIDLPSDVLAHPIITEMENLTIDLGALANDIYSYRKESMEDGAPHNFITVASHDPDILLPDNSLQTVMDYATAQFSTALARFMECKGQLPALIPSEHIKKIERCSESMLDLIFGNVIWSINCKRYSVFEEEPHC